MQRGLNAERAVRRHAAVGEGPLLGLATDKFVKQIEYIFIRTDIEFARE
jgi:hypothetical protein